MSTRPTAAIVLARSPTVKQVRPNAWRGLRSVVQRLTTAQVAPAKVGPTVHDISSSSRLIRRVSSSISTLHRQSVVAISLRFLSFSDAFGLLGIPMLLVAIVCISWTIWLIQLTIAPNQTVNYLMDTGDYDDGQFWLISEELTALQILSVIGLVVVACLYVFVLLKMLVWRKQQHVEGSVLDCILQRCLADQLQAPGSTQLEFSHRAYRMTWELYLLLKELTSFNGKHRKIWNLCLKAFDLMMQTTMLLGLLDTGVPVHLAFGFAMFAALNSASCAIEILCRKHSAFTEILVDSLFDLCATVLFPVLVLLYCAKTFTFNRAEFLIYLELMPVGSFERRARMFANPDEIELFRVGFDALRIRSMSDLFLRIGMNLGFSYRLKRVVEVLIQAHTKQKPRQHQKTKLGLPKPKRSCQQAAPRPLASLFIVYSVGVLVFAHKAISTSRSVCSAHPQCVVYAHRWTTSGLCPCRALVDGNRAPRTYYEWTHPVDATESVKALAASGTLQTIQLINQQLTVLPDELRGCRGLTYLSLINCATTSLPTWMNKFHRLEYLDIEGKQGSDNLGNLAPDLFNEMPQLRYLQLGLHQRMTQLPSINASSLCCLTMARMNGFTGLPAFPRSLKRIEFAVMKRLSRIPDLTSIGPIVHFAVFQDATLCCNGFLGTCDLSNPYCTNTTCIQDPSLKATPATLRVVQRFSSAVCQPYSGLSQTITSTTIQMCDGVPFRQCHLPGPKPNASVVGICYNHRMQVLACNPDPNKILVRRRQIQERVGLPCDPVEEAWLGCPTSQ